MVEALKQQRPPPPPRAKGEASNKPQILALQTAVAVVMKRSCLGGSHDHSPVDAAAFQVLDHRHVLVASSGRRVDHEVVQLSPIDVLQSETTKRPPYFQTKPLSMEPWCACACQKRVCTRGCSTVQVAPSLEGSALPAQSASILTALLGESPISLSLSSSPPTLSICLSTYLTVRNCLISPFFFGPLQMTALSC